MKKKKGGKQAGGLTVQRAGAERRSFWLTHQGCQQVYLLPGEATTKSRLLPQLTRETPTLKSLWAGRAAVPARVTMCMLQPQVASGARSPGEPGLCRARVPAML